MYQLWIVSEKTNQWEMEGFYETVSEARRYSYLGLEFKIVAVSVVK